MHDDSYVEDVNFTFKSVTGYYNESLQYVEASNYCTTEPIECSYGDNFTVTLTGLGALAYKVAYFDADKNIIAVDVKGTGSNQTYVETEYKVNNELALYISFTVFGGSVNSASGNFRIYKNVLRKVLNFYPSNDNEAEIGTFLQKTEDGPMWNNIGLKTEYKNTVETLGLVIDLCKNNTSYNTENVAHTNYLSMVSINLKTGDEIGFIDSSWFNTYKFNIMSSTGWIGYRETENYIVEANGVYGISIAKKQSAVFTEIERDTVDANFGIMRNELVNTVSMNMLSDDVINYINDLVANSSNTNVLSGKKMACLGDSLTYGHTLGIDKTWPAKIANRNNMQVYNYGVNGNPLASVQASDDVVAVAGMVERYTSMPDDMDYITVMGGANDLNKAIEIGTNSDTSIYTFKGACNVLIDGLRKKYPKAHIIFMTNFNRGYSGELAYVDAMIEVCALKGMPCKDNYRNSGIYFKDTYQSSVFDLGIADGGTANKHFSELGNEFISYGIEEFLKSH